MKMWEVIEAWSNVEENILSIVDDDYIVRSRANKRTHDTIV